MTKQPSVREPRLPCELGARDRVGEGAAGEENDSRGSSQAPRYVFPLDYEVTNNNTPITLAQRRVDISYVHAQMNCLGPLTGSCHGGRDYCRYIDI
jgi:hypothetical protein